MRNFGAKGISISRRDQSANAVQLDPRQRAWVEVNSNSIECNARTLKAFLRDGCSLMAVVKADGYGHGSITVAKAALKGGAQSLGVATLSEGIELREAGIKSKILILGNLINQDEFSACLSWELTPTISSIREAIICQNLAARNNYKFKIHLKVDTGMTRLGCSFHEAPTLVNKIDCFPNLCLEGVYSHLAMADENIEYDSDSYRFTELQRKRFENFLTAIGERSSTLSKHLANSAGTLREPNLHFDMVRIGIALYGYCPISNFNLGIPLEPALTVKARVTLTKDVPEGIGVGYGHQFKTKRRSRLAVVGIGYADGVNRLLSGKISCSIGGVLVPQVGAIAMDQMMIDITDAPEVKVGSIVTLLGNDGKVSIPPQEWSEIIGSIPWEVLCAFKHRLPRLLV